MTTGIPSGARQAHDRPARHRGGHHHEPGASAVLGALISIVAAPAIMLVSPASGRSRRCAAAGRDYRMVVQTGYGLFRAACTGLAAADQLARSAGSVSRWC
jgi:hypothetical protein